MRLRRRPAKLSQAPAMEPPLFGPQPVTVAPQPERSWSAIDGYDILQCLGEGSTGVVYRARHTRFNREVALKLLRLPGDGAARQVAVLGFFREVKAAARMSHPNIVSVFDAAEFPGRCYYIVREYVAGATLQRLVGDLAISLRTGVGVVRAIAGAIRHVHQRQLVHRGLCSTNVLVAVDGTPKLIGFGRAGPLANREEAEMDLRALEHLLTWLCDMLREPLPPRLDAMLRTCSAERHPAAYRDAGEFQDALAECLEEM